MQLEDYKTRSGKKVWLTKPEIDLLLENAGGKNKRIAMGLGLRSGLRTQEIIEVEPPHVVHSLSGYKVRVWEGKDAKYREPPTSPELYDEIIDYTEWRTPSKDTPLVDVRTRSIRRWVTRAAERCYEQTGDCGWKYVTPHDFRRTWAMLLLESGVEMGMVMEWGGWESWSSFREHYLGRYSPSIQRREVKKVDWLSDGTEPEVEAPAVPESPYDEADRMARFQSKLPWQDGPSDSANPLK
ncbi:tyrosine-type recombinase/integrase [Natrinema sp. LN54]|uniref:tyrosine-type recombinase/integrase n=1 Tax=Natrinema sp. LN54 TaxID=3458705 RepID=UPI004035A8AC